MVTQLSLIPEFDGATYSTELDGTRLTTQFMRVKAIMLDRQWHSPDEVARRVGGSGSGVTARMRDLRKARNGGYTVELRRVAGGLWEYRIGGSK